MQLKRVGVSLGDSVWPRPSPALRRLLTHLRSQRRSEQPDETKAANDEKIEPSERKWRRIARTHKAWEILCDSELSESKACA